jgi:hypothetical protein
VPVWLIVDPADPTGDRFNAELDEVVAQIRL